MSEEEPQGLLKRLLNAVLTNIGLFLSLSLSLAPIVFVVWAIKSCGK